MNRKFQLNSVDMATFLIQASIGVRLLTLPREIARWAYNDSWISVLLAFFLVLVLSLMLYWLGSTYAGDNGSQITVKIFGNFIGKIGVILIGVHTIGSMGLGLRVMGNSVKLFLLPRTPLTPIMWIMILLALYALLKGLKVIATLMNILLPQLLFFMALLLILPVGMIDFQNIFPILNNGIRPVLHGTLEALDSLYGFIIIAYLLPYFKERKGTVKWIFVGLGISASIYLGITLMCIFVFGAKEINYVLYPTLSLAKSIELTVHLIERAESLFMIVWGISTFAMMTLSYFVSYENLKVLFGNKHKKLLIYGQLPLILFIAYLPQNGPQVQLYSTYLHWLGRSITLGMIPLLVIITFLKERKKKYEAQS